jgi:hypothetical protein
MTSKQEIERLTGEGVWRKKECLERREIEDSWGVCYKLLVESSLVLYKLQGNGGFLLEPPCNQEFGIFQLGLTFSRLWWKKVGAETEFWEEEGMS